MTKKIKVYVETNLVGSRCEDSFEVDATEWDNMTEEEKDAEVQEIVWNMASYWYEEE